MQQKIPIRLLRPGDFFVFQDSPTGVPQPIAFCISNERYLGEGYNSQGQPTFGRSVKLIARGPQIMQLFWKEDSQVGLL